MMAYELTPSSHAGWKERILHQFKCGTSEGTYPASSLIFDSAGNLFGTTSGGGAYHYGAIFELTHTESGAWTESLLYSFTGNADGYEPSSAVVLDAAGNLYGVTEYGGSGQCFDDYNFGCGVLYELSPTSQALGPKRPCIPSWVTRMMGATRPARLVSIRQEIIWNHHTRW